MKYFDNILEKLNTVNIKELSRTLGIHYNTLYRIKSKKIKPNYRTMIKLVEFFDKE